MATDRGNILINRNLLEQPWFSKPGSLHLLIYLLLKASWRRETIHGVTVDRGQVLTSLKELHEAMPYLSIQNIRSTLTQHEANTTLTRKSIGRKYIITICNYDSYQQLLTSPKTQTNTKLTRDQHETNTNAKKEIEKSPYNPLKEKKEKPNEITKENNLGTNVPLSTGQPVNKRITIDSKNFIRFWNKMMDINNANIPRIKSLSPRRKAAVIARLKDIQASGYENPKEELNRVIEYVAQNDILNARKKWDHPLCFDTMFTPKIFQTIWEHNYGDPKVKRTKH